MNNHEFIQGLHQLRRKTVPCVATIGSFDGVHRGHQQLIGQVKRKASEMGLPSMVMLFEPQPNEYFAQGAVPARLMKLREKIIALFEIGINRVVCLKFDQSLRSLSAKDYIQKVLLEAAGVKALIIGDDFRFGCDRVGDFTLLKETGLKHGFGVWDTQTHKEADSRISSTLIRKLLSEDRLNEANMLLGRPFGITGRVSYGKQLGRQLGFPTMNIVLGRSHSPLRGVYTVNVKFLTGQAYKGVANLGMRPTIAGRSKPILEVHLLNKNIDAYGKFINVTFIKKLRNEMKFESVEALRDQVHKDIAIANASF